MSSLSQRVFQSASLLLLVRFLQRGIGLISTLILARILAPEDFGVVAVIAVVIQFFEVISAVGSKQYLIQKSDIDEEDLDTAFTINLCMKSGLWILLVVTTPFIASFLENPELTTGLWIASLALLINMLVNPGIVEYERALDYSKIVRLSIIQKIVAFATVMLVVFFHQSYWALIFGNIVSALVFTIGSYIIQPHRPSFSLSRFKLQFNFSQWVFYRSIFGFIRTQIDTILVSKNYTLTELGVFHLVKSLIYMPATDVIAPAIEPLLSAFSRVKDNADDLAYKIRVAFCFVTFLVFPLCTYIILFPEYIVNVLLGKQWTDAYPLMPFMAPLLLILSINKIYETICISLGKVKQLFYYNIFSTLILTTSLLLTIGYALDEFVLVRSLVHLAIVFIFPFYLKTLLNIGFRRVVYLCFPTATTSILAGTLVFITDSYFMAPDLVKLVTTTTIFGISYILILLALYHIWFKKIPEYQSIFRVISLPIKNKMGKYINY